MRFTTIYAVLIVFCLGWMLNDIFAEVIEEPNVITSRVIYSMPEERLSPSDIISQDDIHVYNDRIVIEVKDPVWATFTDTNSMDPVIDEGSHALQIVPSDSTQINEGDIISFSTKYDDGTIIHRVIEVNYDDDGWYAITKGDNNPNTDPGKVRFKDVKKLLIGVIY